MLHKEIPFLRIGVSVVTGIVACRFFAPDIRFLVMLFICILFILIILQFFRSYSKGYLVGIVSLIAFLIAGMIMYRLEKSGLSELPHERLEVSGVVTDYPEKKTNSSMLVLKMESRKKHSQVVPLCGSLMIYLKNDVKLNLAPGDRLLLTLTPEAVTNKGNPGEFDFRFYLENQGIRYFAFTGDKDLISYEQAAVKSLRYSALKVRERIINIFSGCGITGDNLALVSAITLGQKRMLDQDDRMIFMKAGVMHIMAVSGLHTIILSVFVFSVLFFLKGRLAPVRIIITLVILWAFAFITGLTPSVLRATLMFSFLQGGKLMKRPVNGINSVLASAFVLILIRPSVIYDAGFLLSYSAVLSIMCFYDAIYRLISISSKILDWVWQSVISTMVAQAGTLPLTIMLFNRFPVYFLLANITIVPISNLLIIIGCVIPIINQIHFLSRLLAAILILVTRLLKYLTALTASLPYSSIENIGISTLQCIILTVFFFTFCYWIINRKTFSLRFPLLLFLFFLLAGLISAYRVSRSSELIVYNTPGQLNIGIRTGRVLNLVCDTLPVRPEVIKHASAMNLKIKVLPLLKNTRVFAVGRTDILITPSLSDLKSYPVKSEMIIVTGRVTKNELLYLRTIRNAGIVFATSSASIINNAVATPESNAAKLFFVRKSGAFRETLGSVHKLTGKKLEY